MSSTGNKPLSLFAYALQITLPAGVAILLFTWFIENQVLHTTIETELREHVEEIERREMAQIQGNLEGLRGFAKSLATNDLIINGLIDLEQRDNYIPIFFQSLIAPLSAEARVSLVDYMGRGIASSAVDNRAATVSQIMVEKGGFFIDSNKLLVVEPILISASAEGAIILSYPRTSFDALFGNPAFPYGLFITGYSDLVVYSSNNDLARTGSLYTGAAPEGWVQAIDDIPDSNLSVAIGSSIDAALESMGQFHLVRMAGLAALMLIITGLVLLSTFIVSRPLKEFTAIISTIKNVDDLNKHLDTRGPREIAEIATTFNRMAEWLKSTTVSRNYMDNIFGSITEGIVTIDGNGIITTFNASASQMFGYENDEIIGKNVSILMHEDERQEHDRYVEKAEFHETRVIAQNRDLQGRRKDGSLFDLELIVTPLERSGQKGYVGTIRDITERKLMEIQLANRTEELEQINRELENMALYDPLTGIGNRNLFTSRLNELVAASLRNNTPFALLMMDLNKFKDVNDTYGHEAGDEILRVTGTRLKLIARDADLFFRLGGDEFAAIVTTGVTESGIAAMARRIIETVKQPVKYNSVELEVGTSIGIVLFPEHGEYGEELLRQADNAMYEAKRGGFGFQISSNYAKQSA